MQWVLGNGYDELLAVPDVVLGADPVRTVGRGIGGELRLAYGLAEHWACRISVSSAMHSSSTGSAGIAWAAADALYRLPLGRLDPTLFARFGKQTLTLDNVQVAGPNVVAHYTYAGYMAGGGGGLCWWATDHISLSAEAAYTYVRIADSVEDENGIHTPLGGTYDGTTWGVTALAVSYHW